MSNIGSKPDSQHPLLFCDSRSVRSLTFKDQKIAVWFHIDWTSEIDLSNLVLGLARHGAVHFAVSGANAPDWHDRIDNALLEAGIASVVTTWHEEPLDEVAWDFANIDFVSGGLSLKCVVVLGESAASERATISRLAKHLSGACEQ